MQTRANQRLKLPEPPCWSFRASTSFAAGPLPQYCSLDLNSRQPPRTRRGMNNWGNLQGLIPIVGGF
jgi:hypothetical protein